MNETEAISRAVLVEGKSQRQVAKETGHARHTIPDETGDPIKKMLTDGEVPTYQLQKRRESPVLGPDKAILAEWVAEAEKKPQQKRRTARRLYTLLRGAEYGYPGAESSRRVYVGQWRQKARQQVYVPLSDEPGEVGQQVDFGEAEVIMAGKLVPDPHRSGGSFEAGEACKAQLCLIW